MLMRLWGDSATRTTKILPQCWFADAIWKTFHNSQRHGIIFLWSTDCQDLLFFSKSTICLMTTRPMTLSGIEKPKAKQNKGKKKIKKQFSNTVVLNMEVLIYSCCKAKYSAMEAYCPLACLCKEVHKIRFFLWKLLHLPFVPVNSLFWFNSEFIFLICLLGLVHRRVLTNDFLTVAVTFKPPIHNYMTCAEVHQISPHHLWHCTVCSSVSFSILPWVLGELSLQYVPPSAKWNHQF